MAPVNLRIQLYAGSPGDVGTVAREGNFEIRDIYRCDFLERLETERSLLVVFPLCRGRAIVKDVGQCYVEIVCLFGLQVVEDDSLLFTFGGHRLGRRQILLGRIGKGDVAVPVACDMDDGGILAYIADVHLDTARCGGAVETLCHDGCGRHECRRYVEAYIG